MSSSISLPKKVLSEEIAAEIARLFPTGADPIELVLSNLSDWLIENKLTGSPCIAHQASFDLGFYEMAVRRCEKQKAGLGPIWICTKSLAKLVLPGCVGSCTENEF